AFLLGTSLLLPISEHASPVSSHRRLDIGRLEWAAASPQALAELLALLGRHALPALVHSLPNALIDSPPHLGARRDTHTQVSEQNPAKSEQSDGLPEGNLPPSEHRRQVPVPQMHHHFAADPDENRHRHARQRGYKQ